MELKIMERDNIHTFLGNINATYLLVPIWIATIALWLEMLLFHHSVKSSNPHEVISNNM